jgi:quercetin dioxygenase-like cupin family protein
MRSTKWMIGAAFAALAAAPSAQQPGFTRAQLQDQPLSVPGRHAVVARAEFVPGGQAGKHTLKAGEVFFVPAGVVHDGRNTGKGKAVVLATYIVETGKPVATPAK